MSNNLLDQEPFGYLLSCETDILNRWKENFAELYNPTSGGREAPSEPEWDETSDISTDEVQAAIRAFKPGEDARIDKIRFQILKSLSCLSIVWLTRVCRTVSMEGRAPVNWETKIVVLIFKNGDRRECSNYRGISLLSLPGKVYSRVLERKY